MNNKISINDKDNVITFLKGINSTNDYLYLNIQKKGSIDTYMNAKINEDAYTLNILENSEFKLSLSAEIMYTVKHDIDGIEDIFGTAIPKIARNAIILGNIINIDEYCKNYRCWETFYFDDPYTIYEYNKWIGSCNNIASKYPNNDLILKCELAIDTNVVYDVIKLIPELKYSISNNILIIDLDSINEYNSRIYNK